MRRVVWSSVVVVLGVLLVYLLPPLPWTRNQAPVGGANLTSDGQVPVLPPKTGKGVEPVPGAAETASRTGAAGDAEKVATAGTQYDGKWEDKQGSTSMTVADGKVSEFSTTYVATIGSVGTGFKYSQVDLKGEKAANIGAHGEFRSTDGRLTGTFVSPIEATVSFQADDMAPQPGTLTSTLTKLVNN